jgi:large subunit ribosomal protein L28
MPQSCHVCGKSIGRGNKVEQSGKPKYLGGNGRKTRGISKRIYRPNLQRIRVQEGETVVPRRVCTQCIRGGKITKAVVRKPFTVAGK